MRGRAPRDPVPHKRFFDFPFFLSRLQVSDKFCGMEMSSVHPVLLKRTKERWKELHGMFHALDSYLHEHGGDGCINVAYVLSARELLLLSMDVEKDIQKRGKGKKAGLRRMEVPKVKM